MVSIGGMRDHISKILSHIAMDEGSFFVSRESDTPSCEIEMAAF